MDWLSFIGKQIGSSYKDFFTGNWDHLFGGTLNSWNSLNRSTQNNILTGGLSGILDLDGSSAAQTQFDNQLTLNHDAQAFNAAEAEKQRAWEQEMASTAYQRQVADMQAAGLNPYAMMAQGYSVGNTPSGSSAQASSGSADMANNKLAAAAGVVAMFLRFLLAKH